MIDEPNREIDELNPVSRPLNRLTVNVGIYHEQEGDAPKEVSARFEESLQTPEESYSRRREIRNTWVPLDTGWFQEVESGLVVIQNLGRPSTGVHLSDEEIKERSKAIIEVCEKGQDRPFIIIRPNRLFFGELQNIEDILIRCQQGSTIYRITVFPR